MKILSLFFLLLAVATSPGAESRRIQFRAVCLAHTEGVKKVLLASEPAAVEIDLLTGSFSLEAEATLADGWLRFLLPGSEEGAPAKTAATVRALPGERHLLIFVPGGKKGEIYRVLAIDDSEQAFPMGSNRLLNLAPRPARFVIGEHARELAPGGTADIPLPRKLNAMHQCPVQAAFRNEAGTWTVFSSTRWHATDRERGLIISFTDPRSGKPAFRRWADVPPWRLPEL